MKLYYTDRARDDIELAFSWYERQRKFLGFDFLDCIDAAVNLILENPEMCRFFYSDFRAYVIRKFPFSIFYTIEGEKIVVHSVFDNRQDPNKRP